MRDDADEARRLSAQGIRKLAEIKEKHPNAWKRYQRIFAQMAEKRGLPTDDLEDALAGKALSLAFPEDETRIPAKVQADMAVLLMNVQGSETKSYPHIPPQRTELTLKDDRVPTTIGNIDVNDLAALVAEAKRVEGEKPKQVPCEEVSSDG